MWQKVNPIGMRVGLVKSWPCEWFGKTKRTWADFFVEDIKIEIGSKKLKVEVVGNSPTKIKSFE